MNFLDHIITFTVTAMLTIGGFFGLVQSPVLPNQALQLGATIATTSQLDTIGTFRTNVNTSLENLNNQLNSVSSTVGTYGNLALENSPLAVLKGGTGTTTVPTEGKFFISNGTIPTWKTATFGGGLTYTTTTTGFTLNTAGIDQSANYTWTGGHIFNSSSTLNSTTTLSGATVISGTTTTISSANLNITSATTTFTGVVNGATKFGGNGSDGALNITSGTTTLDIDNANVLVKNYSSISITGTSSLAFSNATSAGSIVILKSKGDCTITSSNALTIDLRLLGGSVSTNGNGLLYPVSTNKGVAAGVSAVGAGGAGLSFIKSINNKSIPIYTGAGGGLGSPTPGSTNGRGGGALYLECGGALNFANGTINASGENGLSGSNKGGNGGGAGGSVIILYTTLTANSGTINVTGGNGGADDGNNSNYGGGGGANRVSGGSGGQTGGAGVAGTSDDSSGGATTGTYAQGGGGASGYKIIQQNTEF